jgi:hypothetical protein
MGPQLVRWIAFVRKVLGIPHHLHDIDWVKRANLRAGSHGIGLVAIVLNMVTIAVITAVTKNGSDLAHFALLFKTWSVNPATPRQCGTASALKG